MCTKNKELKVVDTDLGGVKLLGQNEENLILLNKGVLNKLIASLGNTSLDNIVSRMTNTLIHQDIQSMDEYLKLLNDEIVFHQTIEDYKSLTNPQPTDEIDLSDIDENQTTV